MTLKQYYKRALSLPIHIVALKVYQLLVFRIKSLFFQLKDSIFPTYSSNKIGNNFNQLFSHSPQLDSLQAFPELEQLITKTLNHEFDLLSSGWTQVSYSMNAKGIDGVQYSHKLETAPKSGEFDWISHLINASNQKKSKSLWKNVGPDYTPIDWHIDFKSGYRWNPSTWWFRVPYGHKPGVDIKIPWEISRMQHLPWLSLGYELYKSKGQYLLAQKCSDEYKNQIMDFISTNPPRYGVNWRCPMDVAIRAANWILGYEWLSHYGWKAEENIKSALADSLYDHADFIYKNLEIGKDGFRGNHYLADICGLAFISAFLPSTPTTSQWLSFSYQALIEEMDFQFFSDGSNFEGSTAYHRLSAEMIFYTTLLFRERNYSFSEEYYKKLFLMSEFSKNITKPTGTIVQIGDNDNGRFFKIQPILNKKLEENHLSQKYLQHAIDAFFQTTSGDGIEASWIRQLTSNANKCIFLPTPELSHIDEIASFSSSQFQSFLRGIADSKNLDHKFINQYPNYHQKFSISAKDSRFDLKCYKDFGLYIWKNEDFFLSFRCGPVGQKGRGGHDHNDQLSFELLSNSVLKVCDPGTGIYTPFPEIRNKYRSVAAHSSPHVFDNTGKLVEPGDLSQGLFSLNSNQASSIVFASSELLIGFNKKLNTVRIIKRSESEKQLDVFDICFNHKWKFAQQQQLINYSLGYGDY